MHSIVQHTCSINSITFSIWFTCQSAPLAYDEVNEEMEQNKKTPISKLGEFGLIRHLTENIELQNASSKYGIGDDCAVLEYPDKQVLVTTDLLMEGVHFDLTYVPMTHLGYKAAIVNFSDIYAMNGTPRQITVSLAISKRFMVEDIEELYAGMKLACKQHGVDIVGGDTTSSITGLAISITAIGTAKAEEAAHAWIDSMKECNLIEE